MRIEIIEIRNVYDPETGELMARHVELDLGGPQGAYLWRRGDVPPDMTRADALAWIEAHFDEIYAEAIRGGERAGGVLDNPHIDTRRLLKAFALVNLDAVNGLRVRAGLEELTTEQLANAIRTKYIELE